MRERVPSGKLLGLALGAVAPVVLAVLLVPSDDVETTVLRLAAGRAGAELPPGGAELQVLSRGQPVGRFVLLPAPGGTLSLEQRVVAVALADQVGAVLGAHPPGQDRRHRSYG